MDTRIFIIEGPSKIGKSSQSFLLSQKLKQNQIFKMDRVLSVEELNTFLMDIEAWLKKDPQNTATLTGSIAFTIVNKDIEKLAFGKSYAEYDSQLRLFLEISKTYGCKAFLLKPQNLSFLLKRHSNPLNLVQEESIYNGLIHFQNYCSNSNFAWIQIPVSPYDSILEVQKKIQSYI